jgi:hypothetical protein
MTNHPRSGLFGFLLLLAALAPAGAGAKAVADGLGQSPSQLLMPLVFGAHAGSMLMLLGVVGGLYEVGIVAAQIFVKHTKAPEPAAEDSTVQP